MTTAAKNISSTDTHTGTVNAPRVLIAAGGTGGHVYPGIAIADAFKKLHPGAEIVFAGTKNRMEWEAVPKAGYAIKSLWISGFHRKLTARNLLFPAKLVTSLIQSYFLIRRFKPDIVISCGGFASGPVGWVASKTGIPLILQEQNSFPGFTNRMLAGKADVVFTAFEEASDHLPGVNVVLSGNPVRSAFTRMDREKALSHFGFHSGSPILLILGGSGGAGTVNKAVEEHLRLLHDRMGLQIIWQCGHRYYEDLAKRVSEEDFRNLRLLKFIDNMPAAYTAADLVVSRAGAVSCSELMLTGKASILIPSPVVAGDHQTKNAASMADRKAAMLLHDRDAVKQLGNVIKAFIASGELLEQMGRAALALARPDAADRIAKEIESRIKREK